MFQNDRPFPDFRKIAEQLGFSPITGIIPAVTQASTVSAEALWLFYGAACQSEYSHAAEGFLPNRASPGINPPEFLLNYVEFLCQ